MTTARTSGVPAASHPAGGGSNPQDAAADLALQQRLLGMIVRDAPLSETLEAMCAGIEERYPEVRCTVLLADHEAGVLRHVAGRSMPSEAAAIVDGMPIADGAGACGTAAATRRVAVVEDAERDARTAPYADLVHVHGLRSVWSVPLVAPDGALHGTFALYRATPHQPDDGEVAAVSAAAALGALAVERHLRAEELVRAATLDALTGLPNRRAFLAQLQGLLDRRKSDISVLFVDVDQFKLVNDGLGHRTGDRMLAEMAGRLRRAIGPPHVVARFGGDEFTVLAVGDRAAVEAVADAVDDAFAEPFPIPGGRFTFAASMGIAEVPADLPPAERPSADDVIRDADAAMYAAKTARRSRVRFDDELRARVLGRFDLETALQEGLEDDQFAVGYMPVVDLTSRRTTSVEALVRWTHPQRGPVEPGEFIELAEETGLIVPLGARVLAMAIQDASALARRGRDLTVAVNVSAIQLSDPGFPQQVAQALALHDLPPDRLVLELTESAALDRGVTPRRVLDEVAAMGVRLVVDDFGTGYASIPLLRDLPVVGVKVDGSFTMAMAADPRMRGVVRAVTDLAHSLDLFVVAEGVDTAEALEAVAELGCDLAQGFHLSPPVPADHL